MLGMTGSSTPHRRLLRTLGGEPLSPPPIWLMRQAGRYLPEYRATRAQAATTFTDRVKLLTCADPRYRDKPLAVNRTCP